MVAAFKRVVAELGRLDVLVCPALVPALAPSGWRYDCQHAVLYIRWQVNNAGSTRRSEFLESTTEVQHVSALPALARLFALFLIQWCLSQDLDFVIDINLRGLFINSPVTSPRHPLASVLLMKLCVTLECCCTAVFHHQPLPMHCCRLFHHTIVFRHPPLFRMGG